MSQASKPVSVFSVAMAIIGTVIGAGYASGQELMQYFGDFGDMAIPGLLVACVGFYLYGVLGMAAARRMNNGNYAEVMSPLKNKYVSIGIDVAMVLVLYGVLVVMVAGSGALFEAQFGVSAYVGAGVLIAVTILSAWWGTKSILTGMNIAVPILIVGAVIVAIMVLINPQADPEVSKAIPRTPNPMLGNWFVAGVNYVTFNMLAAVCAIIPLAVTFRSNSKVHLGAGFAALVLVILAGLLVMGIVANYVIVQHEALPMLALAKGISPMVGYLYAVFMFAAIFSTAIGVLLGLLERFKNVSFYKPRYDRPVTIVLLLATLVMSKVGFITLVGTVYPFFGYLSLAVVAFMLVNYFYYAPGRKRG
ncbi:MAG: hypothetical protein LBM64_06680 [Deltaproteobacteria bacterium]|jgi:uncharacterized membrane protein YkvI|nr:hypothetical protein [Deltaproteobacteria bacterium]